MNNEPVAWMLMRSESCVEITEWYGVMRDWEEFLGDNEKIVELFTHPVKEPTDAITLLEKYADKLEDERPNKGLSDVVLECVEILRKAQEK